MTWLPLDQQRVENEKVIRQTVGISKVCDQNGHRVSKNDKICQICSIRLKGVFWLKIWDSVYVFTTLGQSERKSC